MEEVVEAFVKDRFSFCRTCTHVLCFECEAQVG